MIMKKIQVVGHRGACDYAPENTMPSFEIAIKMGVDSLETDIRTTSDGVLVLFHDNQISRTSTGTGTIEEQTYEQLNKLDYGVKFSPKFAGTKIVTLSEFLIRYGNVIHLNLEIKSPDIEKKVLDEIKKENIDYSNYVITAFELDKLNKIRELDPVVTIGYLSDGYDKSKVDLCIDKKINHICPHSKDMNTETSEYAHSKGLFIRAWGIADIKLMENAILCGADGMTVNFPDKLIEYLKSKGYESGQ